MTPELVAGREEAPLPFSGIDRSKHTRVDIRWYAVPNMNKASGGFLPMVDEDGKPRGDTWRDRGYAKWDAEAMAKERANELASRFVGDWNVVVGKREAKPFVTRSLATTT